jgi:hypothetical protein
MSVSLRMLVWRVERLVDNSHPMFGSAMKLTVVLGDGRPVGAA